MELGFVALVQSRLDSSAGVHQAAVAVVLVRLDSADVEVAAGAIVTLLHQRVIFNCRQRRIPVWLCVSVLRCYTIGPYLRCVVVAVIQNGCVPRYWPLVHAEVWFQVIRQL